MTESKRDSVTPPAAVTHEVGKDLPPWSLDPDHSGIIVLGSTDDARQGTLIGLPDSCQHFAPMAISAAIPVRCRRPRGHDGAHEIVMVWLP